MIGGTFYTLIGAIFLVIVLISPGGLMGMWDSLFSRAGRAFAKPPSGAPVVATAGDLSAPDAGSRPEPEGSA